MHLHNIMARIKFGMMMTDARGKLGGQVFSKTRSGAIVRTKVTPVNPRSVAQANARAILGDNSGKWATLTEEQRLSWIAAADNVVKTNIFGDNYKPSGKNLFVGTNANLTVASLAVMTTAPDLRSPGSVSEINVIVDKTAGDILVTYGQISADNQAKVVIKATRPFSAGKYNFSGQSVIINVSPIGTPIEEGDLYAAYVARFGIPAIGTKIGFEFFLISSTGVTSPPAKTASIVV